jgi:hypothetical protein
VQRINEAIVHANAGNHAAALKVLDEVIPEITDPAMLAEAKKFRAEMAARVGKKK